MTDKEVTKVLECISYAPEGDKRDEATKSVLKAASDSIDLKVLKNLLSEENNQHLKGGSVEFTKKEIERMPEYMQRIFIVDENVVSYRYHNGLYHARYRRDGYNIEVASKDYKTMKMKFIAKFTEEVKEREEKERLAQEPAYPLFSECFEEWLNWKADYVKPATLKSYREAANANILPVLGGKRINEITRRDVKDFMSALTKAGKHRTAQYVLMILSSFYKSVAADYEIPSPVTNIVLPPYETKKGSALTKAEERQLIDFCVANPGYKGSSAILVLIYTGMRVGELKSLNRDDDYIYCVSEKTRKGHREVIRKIPISPMLRRVMPHIDFDMARNSNEKNAYDVIKFVFPNHYVHELRYTFITRAKECGVNPEVVMKFVGHSSGVECVSSRVDMGYTDFSDEYIYSEIQKMDYDL